MDSSYTRPETAKGIELLTCTAATAFPAHIHEGYNIWFNDRGGEYFRYRGETRIVGTDDFGIVNPGEVHANHPCEENARRLRSFYVDVDFIRSMAARCGLAGPTQIVFPEGIYRDRRIRTRLADLHRSLQSTESWLQRQCLMVTTFSHLIRRFGEPLGKASKEDGGSPRISRVLEYMHAHAADDISLDILAGLIPCTSFHLIRLFKQATGLPPHAYLVRLRIEKAKQLLARGIPIALAAQECGFSDQSHLTRLFKKSFGITPKVYAKQVL